MRNWILSLMAVGAGLAAIPAQADVLLASQNYDDPIFVAPGVGAGGSPGDFNTATVGAWNAVGWAGVYFDNRATGNPAELSSLTLSGLAPNSAVRIGSGILGFLESWDSSDGGGGYGPDYLDIFINGSLVASLTTNTALGTVEDYAGAVELFEGVQANDLYGYYSDVLIDLSTASFGTTLADGAGVWTLGIQARGAGWQGSTDEGWGVDNLSFYGTIAPPRNGAVPEPASWMMMIGGLGLAGAAIRRQRRTVGLTFG